MPGGKKLRFEVILFPCFIIYYLNVVVMLCHIFKCRTASVLMLYTYILHLLKNASHNILKKVESLNIISIDILIMPECISTVCAYSHSLSDAREFFLKV